VIRQLKHPQVTICDDVDGLSIEFRAPGSEFGPVEVIVSADEAEKLAEDIETALVFASAENS
jgi:hypothetical protein